MILSALLTMANPALANPALAEPPCAQPEGLALRDIALPMARRAVARGHDLVILTLGGLMTEGAFVEDPAATYPAQLQTGLRAALPGKTVTVINGGKPGVTATDIPALMTAGLTKSQAQIVIWGPGGRDVALRLDQKDFQRAVDEGIAAARGNADLILLDMTFVPSPNRMALIVPYRERLRRAAEEAGVPFLLRHDLMRAWAEDKTLNLDARRGEDRKLVMRRLFACTAQSLVPAIAAAVR